MMKREGSTVAAIIIPSWNGRELLSTCLPHLEIAIKYDGRPLEVIVVDDGSTDHTAEFVTRSFPWVKVIKLTRNMGFARACNVGATYATSKRLVILNNDTIVERDFIGPLLNRFDDESVFAVTSQIFFQDKQRRREESGKTYGVFRYGLIWLGHSSKGIDRSSPALYAGGGSTAYDRIKFLELGGFDELFRPFYGEDVDISFRAWKRGWKVIYEPRSVVHHKHRATISRFRSDYVEDVKIKNQLLFMWKNITSPRMLVTHFLFLPLSVSRQLIPYRSVRLATRQIGECLSRKRAQRSTGILSDTDVLKVSSKEFFYKEKFLGAKKDSGSSKSVLFICPYLPRIGLHGGGRLMYEIITRLAQTYNVSVLSFIDSPSEMSYAEPLRQCCKRVELVLRHPHFSLGNFIKNRYIFNDFYDPNFDDRLLALLGEDDYDIVQFEYSQMAQHAIRSRRFKNVLTIVELNFLREKEKFHRAHKILKKTRQILAWWSALDMELSLSGAFDGIVVLTGKEKEELLRFVPQLKVEVIGIGVDTEYFSPMSNAKEEPNSLVFEGYFRHYPNVDAMIYFCREILPLIRKAVPDVTLNIVGAYPPPEILQLERLKGVKVTGYVEDIRPWIARGSVYIAPLISGWGARLKILEAWAMSKPVVSTSRGCLGLEAVDGWNTLMADTPEQFASRVLLLLKNPELRLNLGINARNVAQTMHNWEEIVSRYSDLYNRLLDGGS